MMVLQFAGGTKQPGISLFGRWRDGGAEPLSPLPLQRGRHGGPGSADTGGD